MYLGVLRVGGGPCPVVVVFLDQDRGGARGLLAGDFSGGEAGEVGMREQADGGAEARQGVRGTAASRVVSSPATWPGV